MVEHSSVYSMAGEGHRERYWQNYVDGAWKDCQGGAATTVLDSYTEAPMAEVGAASGGDVDAAVAAAREAFDSWSTSPLAQRQALVHAIGDRLAAEAQSLAAQITREVGMPLNLSSIIQVDMPVKAWRRYAELAGTVEWQKRIGHSTVSQAPIGVVACITPWNYPLHQITSKVAPALVAGCSVVLKPSELAPASAFVLARAAEAVGLPAGVFNLVWGDGAGTGRALISHPDVDMVSFTGSTRVGEQVGSIAGGQIKRLALELGGKSACIALPDADPAAVARHALSACMLNSGQSCNAISRLLVPRAMLEVFRTRLAEGIGKYVMGDPMDRATRLGPLVSRQQQARVRGMAGRAMDDGCEVFAGNAGMALPPTGFFVPPLVLLANGSEPVAREEVFGPVLCVIPYDDEEQAVAIANDTDYGLAGAVWSAQPQRAFEVARRMRAGQVDVNGAAFNPLAPFGGFRKSGLGREGGLFGIEEFLEPHSIQMPD
ncbi:MAG TPA: aldehyde dehydrogenase family protein [Bordetella sp.]